MLSLPEALSAWDSESFAQTLQEEVERLAPGTLPLDKCLARGDSVDDARLTARVLQYSADEDAVRAKVGIFFTEILAGCSCGEEPMPLDAYCVLQVRIDRRTAEAVFEAIQDA